MLARLTRSLRPARFFSNIVPSQPDTPPAGYTAIKAVEWNTFQDTRFCQVLRLDQQFIDDLELSVNLRFRQIPLYYLVLMGLSQSFDQIIHYPILLGCYGYYRSRVSQFSQQVRSKTLSELHVSESQKSILVATCCDSTNKALHQAFPSQSSLVTIPTQHILKYTWIDLSIYSIDPPLDKQQEQIRLQALKSSDSKKLAGIFKGYEVTGIEGKNMLELDKKGLLLSVASADHSAYFELIINLPQNRLSGHNDVLVAMGMETPFSFPQ